MGQAVLFLLCLVAFGLSLALHLFVGGVATAAAFVLAVFSVLVALYVFVRNDPLPARHCLPEDVPLYGRRAPRRSAASMGGAGIRLVAFPVQANDPTAPPTERDAPPH